MIADIYTDASWRDAHDASEDHPAGATWAVIAHVRPKKHSPQRREAKLRAAGACPSWCVDSNTAEFYAQAHGVELVLEHVEVVHSIRVFTDSSGAASLWRPKAAKSRARLGSDAATLYASTRAQLTAREVALTMTWIPGHQPVRVAMPSAARGNREADLLARRAYTVPVFSIEWAP